MTRELAPSMPSEVARAFDALPAALRPTLDRLRNLIFEVARAERAGPVEETLRWGQPAYVAPGGATLRLGRAKTGAPALFVTCSTTLIDDFRPVAPPGLRFDGTRAVLFEPGDGIDAAALSLFVARALTYHRREHPVGRRTGRSH